jgi:hypothetical protein
MSSSDKGEMLRSLWHAITSVMTSWHQGKLFIEHAVAISHDTLHAFVGVLVWLALPPIVRRPLSSLRPWLWVLALILWNETVDLWTEQWPDPGMQYGEGAKDVLLTMFLPTVLMLALRFRPGWFGAGGRRRR